MADSDSIRIQANLETVRATLAAAAARAQRDPEEITLVAVSKTWPAEWVRFAVDAGQRVFGENKVQEGEAKAPLLPSFLDWHHIGNLQKNKVRKALAVFSTIHGVDSLELARQIDRVAAEEGLEPSVYLQVNLAREASKHGFTDEQLRQDLEALLELSRLRIQGLMIIPPFTEDAEAARPMFAALRALRDELIDRFGVPLPGLSMGMSHDYPIAIEEGATLVRVGSAIFGSRG
jgi:pyridoxal phosphate enzyme (YggS family)